MRTEYSCHGCKKYVIITEENGIYGVKKDEAGV